MMTTMIKANELRIGNWIYYNGKLSKIDLTDFRDILEDNYEINYYKPIFLTEEILLKCGFENKGIDDNWIIFRFKSIRICKTEMLGFIFNFDNGEEYVKVKYLHQLQNLYLCLCGEELEINL